MSQVVAHVFCNFALHARVVATVPIPKMASLSHCRSVFDMFAMRSYSTVFYDVYALHGATLALSRVVAPSRRPFFASTLALSLHLEIYSRVVAQLFLVKPAA